LAKGLEQAARRIASDLPGDFALSGPGVVRSLKPEIALVF
jgi:hypothetical protein